MRDFQEQCQTPRDGVFVVFLSFSFFFFPKRSITKLLLDSFFVLSGKIKISVKMLSASAFGSTDNTYLDLDFSGYHKNLIQ